MTDYIEAVPHYNERNNYVLFLFFNTLQIKTVKNYTVLIKNIINTFSKRVYIFEKNITAIESKHFSYCNKLKKVIIPDTVIYIGNSAFDNCHFLKKIVIPDIVSYIG